MPDEEAPASASAFEFASQLPAQPSSESASPAKKARVSRRVRWTQPGSTENPKSSDTETPERDRPENWGERALEKNSGSGSNSNDEQLRRDKPPHWG